MVADPLRLQRRARRRRIRASCSFSRGASSARRVVDDATYAERYLGFDDAGAFRAMLADAGQAPRMRTSRASSRRRSPCTWSCIGDSLVVFEGAPEIVRRRAKLGPRRDRLGRAGHEIEHALP